MQPTGKPAFILVFPQPSRYNGYNIRKELGVVENMKKWSFPKINKSILGLAAIQLVILFLALGSFLVHKQDSFSRNFTVDDYAMSAGQLTEDLAIIEDSSGHTGSFLRLNFPAEPGSYLVSLQYLATGNGSSISAYGESISNLHFRSSSVALKPTTSHASLTFELDRATDNLYLDLSYGGAGTLEIHSITVQETTSYYKRQLIYALGLCILINLGYLFFRAPKDKRKAAFLLGGIFLASCTPLFLDYLIAGHDLPFHLLRIEGVHQSLRQGIFPVKIDPVWAQDYGYAVSVFYGNALLYIPALFRLFGFTVMGAYKAFVVLINLATVLIAYYSFRTMFHSTKAGLWGSLFYTLSLYRLSDLYVRASVGEYCALTFLPLVLCGFFLAFQDARDTSRKWWQISGTIALGLTGIIQSHVLTCEMIAVFVVLVCLILIKKVFRLRTFRTLAVGAGLTLLLNLGFLVPFLDFYNGSINIRSEEWGGGAFDLIQGKGMFPAQLFSLFQKTNGGTWDTISGITTEATYAPGIVLILGLALFLYLILCEHKKKQPLYYPALLCSILGGAALWMSSCYFPYDQLSGLSEAVASLISPLQFPWRFLAIATVLLVFTLVYTLGMLCPGAVYDNTAVKEELIPSDEAATGKEIANGALYSAPGNALLIAGLAILFVINVTWFFYDFTITGNPYRVYETHELDSMALYSEEYLPTGTDSSLISAGRILADGCSYTDYFKEGTTIRATVTTDALGGYLELPLNYYKYYACEDLSSGEKFPVSAGCNNMVKVSIPGNYTGQIEVSFQKPWFWTLSEILSVFSLIAVVCSFLYRSRKTNQNS